MPPVYVVLTSTGVVVGVLSCPRAADDLAYNEAVARDEETGDGVQGFEGSRGCGTTRWTVHGPFQVRTT